jgi:hypothetical protein
MATQLQIRRGTSAQVAAFTGAEGEVVVNTTNDSIHVNDGSTAGGFELARADLNNVSDTDLNAALTGNTVSALTVTALTTGSISTTGNISFGDNDKAIFGGGSDLQIYHDGSQSVIYEGGTGPLDIRSNSETFIKNGGGTETLAHFANNGAVTLYHDNAAKLATNSTGIDVTGVITTDGMTTSADINFGDNDKAIFGAGSDLQIFHDAFHSFIKDSGTGHLKIQATNLKLQDVDGNNYIDCIDGSYVRLMHNTATKLETTSTGIDVTGEITADALTINSSGVQIGTVLQSTSTTSARLALMDANTTAASQVGIGATGNTLGLYAGGGLPKVVVSGTGIDVTGTVTADGLTVDAGSTSLVGTLKTTANNSSLVYADSSQTLILKNNDANGTARLKFLGTASESGAITFGSGVGATSDTFAVYPRVMTGGKAFNITGGGDISFYEDTGTTPKLFWDASAESLGLGTTSPAFAAGAGLEIEKAGTATLRLQDTTNTANGEIRSGPSGIEFFSGAYGTSGDPFSFSVSGTTALTIDSSRNVGIGSSSPAQTLHLKSADPVIRLEDSNPDGIYAQIDGAGGSLILSADQGNGSANSNIVFKSDNSERLRIDASGNLLVGKTSAGINGEGFEAAPSGYIAAVRDGGTAGYFQRKTSGGEILNFRKDNITVGSIGTRGGDVYLETGDTGIRMYDQSDAIIPVGSTGVSRDAAIDLGLGPNLRFKDLYLSGISYSNTVYSDLNLTLAADYNNNSSTGNSNILFQTDGTERARIDASGDLLVGGTTLGQDDSLGVAQNGKLTIAKASSSSAVMASFKNGGTSVGTIVTSTTTTAYNTSSDQRLKENIADADDAGSKVDAIQIRKFDWIADGSHQDYGMIAQELQTVAPEAVSGDADSDEMMGVDYSKLVPMLVKEIQSLRARVAQLEN